VWGSIVSFESDHKPYSKMSNSVRYISSCSSGSIKHISTITASKQNKHWRHQSWAEAASSCDLERDVGGIKRPANHQPALTTVGRHDFSDVWTNISPLYWQLIWLHLSQDNSRHFEFVSAQFHHTQWTLAPGMWTKWPIALLDSQWHARTSMNQKTRADCQHS